MYSFNYYKVPKVKTSYSQDYIKFFELHRNEAKKLGISTTEYLEANNIVFTGEKHKYPGHEFREGKKYIIYALTKPGTDLLYIGITSVSLEFRYSRHLMQNSIGIMDKTFDINFVMLTDDINDERKVIYHFLNDPNYTIINRYVYAKDNDPDFEEKYRLKHLEYSRRPEVVAKAKIYNSQPHKKEQRNDYQKTSPHAKKYRAGYYKYYWKAKAEGLTVNEYKIKYNL